MRTKHFAYILTLILALAAFAQPLQAQNNAGESVKKFGQRVKEAITDTYHDAVSAIRGESSSDKNSSASTRAALSAAPKFYVSLSSGSNRAEGTREDPFKNIQKALDVAPEGALILVSEGNYFGTLRSGKPRVIPHGTEAVCTEL